MNYKTCCFFPSIDFTNDVAFLVSQVSFTLHVADVTTPTFPVVTWTSPKIQGLLPFTLNLEFISFSKMVLDRVVQKSHETSLPFENFALKPCPRSYWVCSRFRYIYIYYLYHINSYHPYMHSEYKCNPKFNYFFKTLSDVSLQVSDSDADSSESESESDDKSVDRSSDREKELTHQGFLTGE